MNDELSKNIPVVLVVAGKKIDYVPEVIQSLDKYCGFKIFYVICPEKDLQRVSSCAVGLNVQLRIINEELIIPELSIEKVKNQIKLKLQNTPVDQLSGWYLQQFLKMSFSLYASQYKYYLIWDADTILLRPITFFEDGKILITQGNEYHLEYFETIRNLFNDINIQTVSHISQHLMVQTSDMIRLINELRVGECDWWINILKSLNGKSRNQFSEYETYANYVIAKNNESYKSIKRNWFRYGNSYFKGNIPNIDIEKVSDLYDFVAFEEWDSGPLKQIRSHALVLARRIYHSISKLT